MCSWGGNHVHGSPAFHTFTLPCIFCISLISRVRVRAKGALRVPPRSSETVRRKSFHSGDMSQSLWIVPTRVLPRAAPGRRGASGNQSISPPRSAGSAEFTGTQPRHLCGFLHFLDSPGLHVRPAHSQDEIFSRNILTGFLKELFEILQK